MSDQDAKSVQVNLRLNEIALMQMDDLNSVLNINRSAIMLQALAAFHRQYFPHKYPQSAAPPPPSPQPPPGSSGSGSSAG